MSAVTKSKVSASASIGTPPDDHAKWNWRTSVEVRKVLKISTCDLAHLREAGLVRVEKRGNAYYYLSKDVEALRVKKLKKGAGFCRLEDAADY